MPARSLEGERETEAFRRRRDDTTVKREPGALWLPSLSGPEEPAKAPRYEYFAAPRGAEQAMERSAASSIRDGAHLHVDESAGEAAALLGAAAVTVGNHIYFGRERYAPGTADGERLLRHELAHVAQAPAGPVAPGLLQVAPADHPGELDAQRVADGLPASNVRVSQPVAFRHPVAPSPVARRTHAQIFGVTPAAPGVRTPGLTLSAFKAYTLTQADWFAEPTLTASDRDALWDLLLWIQTGPHVLAGAGDVEVSELVALSAPARAALSAFCRGTHQSQHTVRIHGPSAYSLSDRVGLGSTLLTLEALVPPATLERTVSQLQLEDVRNTPALLSSLVVYWSLFEPQIQRSRGYDPMTPGGRGPEFQKVIDLLNAVGSPAGLLQFLPLRGASPAERWVRNLHRFSLPMLQRLMANLTDTSGARRLVLVLHSAHDDSAFQTSASLFENLVLSSPNLVLMIEGATSLADVTGRIPTIASTWGHPDAGGVRRLSQVIIAGHGQDRSIQLAGPAGAPESLDLDTNAAATTSLLDTLVRNMDPATARLLFAGCLVGATKVAPGTPAAAIPGALSAHQSLGRFTETLGVSAGLPAGFVQAARASVGLSGATSLFNPVTGDVGLVYPFDPNAYGSASSYASSGREPEGVLRAAVEVGAGSVAAGETVLRTRLAMAPVAGDWWDACTRLLVSIALSPVAPGAGLDLVRTNELANVAEAVFLTGFGDRFGASVSTLRAINSHGFAADVYTGMAATGFYTAPTSLDHWRQRLLVDQAWLSLAGAPRVAPLSTSIASSGWNAAALARVLDTGVLSPHVTTLLPLGGAPTAAQLRLALAWFSLDGAQPHVRAFLSAQVTSGAGAPAAFSAAVTTELAAAGMTDREVLDALGFATATTTTTVGGVTTTQDVANAEITGDTTNDVLVSGHPYEARVTSWALNVRAGPSMAHPPFHWLQQNDPVRVMGFTHHWAAIDVGGRLGFVFRSFITAP